MILRTTFAAFGLAAGLLALTSPAFALSSTECSVKWNSAKDQKVVPEGMKWNDFRKAECGSEADPVKFSTLGAPAKAEKPAKPAKKTAAAAEPARPAIHEPWARNCRRERNPQSLGDIDEFLEVEDRMSEVLPAA